MKRVYLILLTIIAFSFMNNVTAQTDSYSIQFNPKNYTAKTFEYNGKTQKVRAFEHIVYVQYPVDTMYQCLNIYVPEEYFHGKKINGYDVNSAPILFPNGIGGYMSSEPLSLDNKGMIGMTPLSRNSTMRDSMRRGGNRPPMNMPAQRGNNKQGSAIKSALERGYVVISAGARGRQLENEEGVYYGKAPAGLVDLKAAVRYIRANDKLIPGDAEKIISNGTSAGGAMSLLLGATGNSTDYNPYLMEIGAADTRDDIFAVSAYCPISDLNHADCAYEWQFNGVNSYQNIMLDFLEGQQVKANQDNELTQSQIKTSAELKTLFPIYLNSLGLKDDNGNLLTLDEQGEGNFKDLVIKYILASAQSAIDKGEKVSNLDWLKVEGGKAVSIDFDAYMRYVKRMKTPPAFDAFDLSAPENHLFGDAANNAMHFTDFSYNNAPTRSPMAAQNIINMMNPLYYLGKADNAKNWHIRYGSIDSNTSFAIEVIIATALRNMGYDVDFAIAWNRPHMGDYDLEELFTWTDSFCR